MNSAKFMRTRKLHGCSRSFVTRTCLGLVFFLALMAGAWSVSAGTRTYPASAENLPPVTIIKEGRELTIRLTDVYDFHGNACPGATMAFQALRYGLELLYGQETPDLADLVIISRSAGGPMDLFDLLMKGKDKSRRTWPPAGMVMDADNFTFQFLRKSTMQTVTVRLQDGLWPEDWFELRAEHKAGTITDEQKKKRTKDRQRVIRTFPGKPLTELFGTPQVDTVVVWGQILPGEIDRHIRDQRKRIKQEQKTQ